MLLRLLLDRFECGHKHPIATNGCCYRYCANDARILCEFRSVEI
jgi:hypothetical protein